MEGRLFEKFQKIKKISKFQKFPKAFPKVSKGVLNVFWGKFFRNFLGQCFMEARDFEKFQKNQKKFQNSKKNPKSFPNISKRVLNVFWGKFLEKF